jgi:hypothetical protein
MLSRTADQLFWMARYTERAGERQHACVGSYARSACEAKRPQLKHPAAAAAGGVRDRATGATTC